MGPVDQALGRLIIADLEGRGGCRLRLYYCARLRLGSGSGGSGGGCGGSAGYMAAAVRLALIKLFCAGLRLRLGSGCAPAPVNAAAGSRLPLPPTQL